MSYDGKRVLFSGHTRPETGATTIRCSRCSATTRLPLGESIRRVAFSVWRPGPGHNRRMRCPKCHRWAWVKVRLVRSRA